MGQPSGLLRLGGRALLHPLFLFCACQDDDEDGKHDNDFNPTAAGIGGSNNKVSYTKMVWRVG